jgi:hypothetical protein
MRIGFRFSLSVISLLVILSATAGFAQESNFPTGPQYLMNYGSPMFARSISTPSMSLSGPPLETGARNSTGDLTAGAQTQTVSVPPSDALPTVDLFSIYYGQAPVSTVEVSFSGGSYSGGELPESILDTGVGQMTTIDGLRERGYGMTLPEAAAFSKARARHASRVYTNADIERLHPNN